MQQSQSESRTEFICYHRFFFNPAVMKAAEILNHYRKSPGEQILPSDNHAVESSDGQDRIVVYYYTKPAHFQIVYHFEKHRSVWMAKSMFTRRLLDHVAHRKLPNELKLRLDKRQQKRLAA